MINGEMRIGVYGGSFAPVHSGHVVAAETFVEKMGLDLLYIIPAFIPPHKRLDAGDDPHHRLAMCELAFAGKEKILVSDMEIARGGTSYTVDTLRALSREDRRLFLLTGTDMMLTLGQWREAETIFKLCYPVYMRRESDPETERRIIAKNEEYQHRFGRIVRRIPCDYLDISSTEIRRRVAAGESVTGLVPEAVERYIRENKLYV